MLLALLEKTTLDPEILFNMFSKMLFNNDGKIRPLQMKESLSCMAFILAVPSVLEHTVSPPVPSYL